jgi:CHASE3 domain sensor protein
VVAPVRQPLSLRRRAVVVIVGLAAVLVGTGAAALIAQDRADAATTRVVEQALPALVAVERMQRAFVDQETSLRGYVLTGQQALLEPYRAAPALLAEQERVLRAAFADDPAAQARLDTALRDHRTWLAVVEPAIELRGQGRGTELDEMVAQAPGVPRFPALRDAVDGLRAAIESRVGAEAARVDGVRSTLTWLLGAAIGLGVLGAVLAVVGVRRAVSRPLGELIDAVERVADGDLDSPVPRGGPPELAALGGAVDRMRTVLNDHRRTAVRAAALRESDRVAADLRDGAVRRLFAIGSALSSLGARHPEAAGGLAGQVDELDRAIADVRTAAAGGPRSGAGAAHTLAARVAEELARAPRLAGLHPALHVDARGGPELPAHVEDDLLAALAVTVEQLAGAGTDDMEVELSITADRACLRLFVRGAGAWPRATRLPGLSPSDAARCRVLPAVGGHTVVEWAVALPDGSPGRSSALPAP